MPAPESRWSMAFSERLRFTRWFALACVLVAGPVLGAEAIHARRATSKIDIDGALDDPAWAVAPPYDAFVETFPRERVPAPLEFRTVAKVL